MENKDLFEAQIMEVFNTYHLDLHIGAKILQAIATDISKLPLSDKKEEGTITFVCEHSFAIPSNNGYVYCIHCKKSFKINCELENNSKG